MKKASPHIQVNPRGPKTRRSSGLMALEQRFMFDGAGLDTAVDQVLGAERTQPLLSATLRSPLATEALVRAQQDAKNFLATLDARGLHELINGGAQAPTEQWLAKANAFLADVQAGRVGVTVQTLADAQMLGALGAFAAQGPDGTPVIYLNDRLLQDAVDSTQVERVMLEELGHWIDAQLNPGQDSAGDEGQRFAATVLGESVSETSQTENDRSALRLGDQLVDVELAAAPVVSVGFFDGYVGTQGTNTNQSNAIKTLSTMGIARVSFMQSDANGDGLFGDGGTQGNDLAGTLRVTLASGTYYDLAGALNWREATGSTVEVFGFILNVGQNASWSYGGQTYSLTGVNHVTGFYIATR